MQTAYNNRETLKKALEGRTARLKALETAANVMEWLSKAIVHLGAVDVSAWSDEETAAFNQTLLEFEGTIHILLEAKLDVHNPDLSHPRFLAAVTHLFCLVCTKNGHRRF